MLPSDVPEDLLSMSAGRSNVVVVDVFLEYILSKWNDMALGQKCLLEQLFETHDDGDGQLSIAEFTAVIHAATPDASQSEVLDLYKRCLAESQNVDEENEDEEDEDGTSMDATKPDVFLAVVLPHVLRSIQETLRR